MSLSCSRYQPRSSTWCHTVIPPMKNQEQPSNVTNMNCAGVIGDDPISSRGIHELVLQYLQIFYRTMMDITRGVVVVAVRYNYALSSALGHAVLSPIEDSV